MRLIQAVIGKILLVIHAIALHNLLMGPLIKLK